jgi:hypothetical protein
MALFVDVCAYAVNPQLCEVPCHQIRWAAEWGLEMRLRDKQATKEHCTRASELPLFGREGRRLPD